jgi:PAS domain S-box-containing protein
MIIVREFTGHQGADESTCVSNEKFRRLYETVPAGIIHLAPDGTIIECNEAYSEMMGYDGADLTGNEYNQLIPSDWMEFMANLLGLMQSAESSLGPFEMDHLRKDGSRIPVEIRFWTNRDGNGVTPDIWGMTIDISDRVDSEKALRRSEEKNRALMESSQHYFLLIDSERKIVDFNSKSADLLKNSLVNIKGMHISELGSELGLELDNIFGTLKNTHSSPIEVLIEGENKKSMWLELHATSLIIEGEMYIQIVGTDITAQKKAKELVDKELEALAALDRAKAEFMDRASHELKTPLTSICCAASIISEYSSTMREEERELFNIIKKGGDRLARLINNIMKSLQIENNVLKIKHESVDLIDLIKKEIDKHENLLALRGHSITFESMPALNITGDQERLKDVISNLVMNAINNTPPHGEIHVKVEIIDDNAEISVSDTGVGLTEEEKPKIFSKFGKIERYGQGLDLVLEGSGLGLFFVKKVIELHGGTIRVESEGRNKGTKFIISLPLLVGH